MARMGHASSEAALRYQHATRERDEAIARRLDEMVSQRASREPEVAKHPEGSEVPASKHHVDTQAKRGARSAHGTSDVP
jgi:hypothetical protein